MHKNIFKILLVIIFIQTFVYADEVGRAIHKLEDKATRLEAMRSLENLGEKAIPSLVDVAKDKKKDRDSRISAILLLGKIKKKEGQGFGGTGFQPVNKDSDDKSSHYNAKKIKETLEDTLITDSDSYCREASALSLGMMADKESIPKSKEALTVWNICRIRC